MKSILNEISVFCSYSTEELQVLKTVKNSYHSGFPYQVSFDIPPTGIIYDEISTVYDQIWSSREAIEAQKERIDEILNEHCDLVSQNENSTIYQVKDSTFNELAPEIIDTIIKASMTFDAFINFLLGGICLLAGSMLLPLSPIAIAESAALISFGIYSSGKGGLQLSRAIFYSDSLPAVTSSPSLDPKELFPS